MQSVGSADITTRRSESDTHTSDVGTSKEKNKKLVDVLSMKTCEKLLVPSFESRKYNCEENLLVISDTGETRTPFRARFEKHKDELKESLKTRY